MLLPVGCGAPEQAQRRRVRVRHTGGPSAAATGVPCRAPAGSYSRTSLSRRDGAPMLRPWTLHDHADAPRDESHAASLTWWQPLTVSTWKQSWSTGRLG
jgi:hypothetical protein